MWIDLTWHGLINSFQFQEYLDTHKYKGATATHLWEAFSKVKSVYFGETCYEAVIIGISQLQFYLPSQYRY